MTTSPPKDAMFTDMNNQNVADDDAHVDQQIGVNYGDNTFHRNEKIYNINRDDPPDRKHEVAIKHLEGGMPRLAEDLLGGLIRAGHATSERAYHYALAVLSDRSLNEINEDVLSAFRHALNVAEQVECNEWRTALDVVRQLATFVLRQDGHGSFDSIYLQKVIDRFDALPPARRAEIARHLSMVVGGAIQDHLDEVDAQRVRTQRMQPDRDQRAWKFFQPDPTEPRLFHPPPTEIDSGTWWRACAGGVAVLVGVLFLFRGLGHAGVLLSIPLLLLGGYLAVRHEFNKELLATRLRRKEVEHNSPPTPSVSPGHWVATTFVEEIHQRVDARFRELRPHVAGDWEQDTRGIREYLKARFVHIYGNAQVTSESLDWLIRWHVRRIGTRWRSDVLFDYRTELRPSVRTRILLHVGLVVAAAGLVALLSAGMIGTGLFLGVGGYFAAKATIAIAAARRDDDKQRVENGQLLAQEQEAYEEWKKVLSDRPNDAEMGRWLDLDKSHLKTLAIAKSGLTNREMISHVVMLQGAPNAMRARVIHGPPRYSDYVVRLFLMTKSGVREIEVKLNFLDGTMYDEQRIAFGYEKLASAMVSEVGVRISNDHPYVIRNGDSAEPLEYTNLQSREFRLTLLNGEDITVIAENFKGIADTTVESESKLVRIALDSSGITGALHILEAVAADGRDWITREQERRKRRLQDWHDGDSEQTGAGPDLSDLLTEEGPDAEQRSEQV